MKLNLNFKATSALQSSIIFTILTFLKPAINILLLPLYLTILPPKEYGIYTIVITITTLVATVGGLKISGAIIPFYYDCKTVEEKNKLLDNVLSFIILFNSGFFLLLLAIGPTLTSLVFVNDDIRFFPYVSLAIASGMFLPIIQSYTSFVKNEKKIIKYATIQLLFIISGVVLQITLINYYQLLGALWAKLITNILTSILVFFYLRKVIRFRLNKKLLKKCLTFSLPLIPFFFVFWIGKYADRYILEKYMSLEDIAVFGLLMTLIGLVTMASEALANSVQPFLFEAYKNILQHTKKINQLFVFYSLGLILFSSFLVLIVSNIHYIKPNNKYLEIIPYFYIAVLPALMNAIQYLFFNIYTYSKKSGRLATISFFTVSIQIVVLFLLVKEQQIYGAIAASFIGNLVSLVWYSVECKNYLKVTYQWRRILPAPIVFLIGILLSVFVNQYYKIDFKTIGVCFPFVIGVILLFIYKKDLMELQFIRKYVN